MVGGWVKAGSGENVAGAADETPHREFTSWHRWMKARGRPLQARWQIVGRAKWRTLLRESATTQIEGAALRTGRHAAHRSAPQKSDPCPGGRTGQPACKQSKHPFQQDAYMQHIDAFRPKMRSGPFDKCCGQPTRVANLLLTVEEINTRTEIGTRSSKWV